MHAFNCDISFTNFKNFCQDKVYCRSVWCSICQASDHYHEQWGLVQKCLLCRQQSSVHGYLQMYLNWETACCFEFHLCNLLRQQQQQATQTEKSASYSCDKLHWHLNRNISVQHLSRMAAVSKQLVQYHSARYSLQVRVTRKPGSNSDTHAHSRLAALPGTKWSVKFVTTWLI